jgi:hypothetical protein
MSGLFNHLMARDKLDLAKELAATALDNAHLRERVNRLECELFWLKAEHPAPPLLELFPGQNGTVQAALAVIDAARLRREERRWEVDRRGHGHQFGVQSDVTGPPK